MTLQDTLIENFKRWRPQQPQVLNTTKHSVTLDWTRTGRFGFMSDQLLYKIEKDNKMPRWFVVYSGGKTTKEIDNLAPRHPHKFRLKVILKATAVHALADRATRFYGDEVTVRERMGLLHGASEGADSTGDSDAVNDTEEFSCDKNESRSNDGEDSNKYPDESGDTDIRRNRRNGETRCVPCRCGGHPWLESRWSEETWTNTATDGTSSVCFCMAVRCGYVKQVQGMLDERPDLIGIVNSTNGYTPLATAVRKGDINTVRFLLSMGAEVDQACFGGQTPLHLAVLAGHIQIVELLLDKGADLQARDVNGLRAEHYAADSGARAALRLVLDRGGDVCARDHSGWTPLFRALCQGASADIVEELVQRGSDVTVVDNAGLPLASAARLLTGGQGRSRDSILRLVDVSYPHEKALANFTRLTKKIHNVHSLINPPELDSKTNPRH